MQNKSAKNITMPHKHHDSSRKKPHVFNSCKILLFSSLLVKYKSESQAFSLNEVIDME